jgi:hypothetical protein
MALSLAQQRASARLSSHQQRPGTIGYSRWTHCADGHQPIGVFNSAGVLSCAARQMHIRAALTAEKAAMDIKKVSKCTTPTQINQ